MWIRTLYKEIGITKKGHIDIFCDNQSTIKISENLIYHSKTKHFKIHLNYVRNMVEKKQIEVKYILTDKQPADMLTKALGKTKFLQCR
jgi:hypothetical protein